jgi:site-specific recombinase XerC
MSPTNPELVDAWQHDAAATLSPSTIVTYRFYLDRFPDPLLDATAFTLRRFLADRSNDLAPGSMQVVRRAVRHFYKWATETALLIPENPAATLPPVRVPETPVRTADGHERDALVAVCTSERDRALVECLFGSGLRRGELMALTVDLVDLDAGVVRVLKSKTGVSRVAPLDGRARDALRAWLAVRPESGSSALWLSADGTPFAAAGAKTLFRRLSVRAGVSFSAHAARRGFAVRWLRAGGSQVGLERAAGWRPGSPMVARYTRGRAEELAIEEAHRIFG